MAMLGIDVVGGAEASGLIGAAPDWLKKAGQAIVPAAASAAEGALADKPKDISPEEKAKMIEKANAKAAAGSEGFFSKTIVAPVRVWHALLGVLAAGGGIYLWKRK